MRDRVGNWNLDFSQNWSMLWKNFHVLSDDSEYECSTSQIHLFGVCTYPIHHYLDATTGEHKQKKLVKMILESSLLGRRLLRSAAILFNFLTFPPLRCIYLCFFSRCRLWLVDSFKANYILKKKLNYKGYRFSFRRVCFVSFCIFSTKNNFRSILNPCGIFISQ